MSSYRATWTSLIIVVRLHAFKNGALLRSALAKTFQLHRKVRRARWSILAWGLWDGLRTGVAEETGSRVGCQGLALGEARCVGLCAGSDAMVH